MWNLEYLSIENATLTPMGWQQQIVVVVVEYLQFEKQIEVNLIQFVFTHFISEERHTKKKKTIRSSNNILLIIELLRMTLTVLTAVLFAAVAAVVCRFDAVDDSLPQSMAVLLLGLYKNMLNHKQQQAFGFVL